MKHHLFLIRSSYAALLYAIIVITGLALTLFVGLWSHPIELLSTHCKTAEFWPSISTLTGDFQPERQIWRASFVLCAPFRLGTLISLFSVFWQRGGGGLSYTGGNIFHSSLSFLKSSAFLSIVMLFCDLFRLIGALTWTMIASMEDLGRHDVGFICFVLLGFSVQVATNILVQRNTYNLEIYTSLSDARLSCRLKRICLIGQVVSAFFLLIFYIRHNATCAPGAYSLATLCEWSFAIFNILCDATAWYELKKDAWVFGASPQLYKRFTLNNNNNNNNNNSNININVEERRDNLENEVNNNNNINYTDSVNSYGISILQEKNIDESEVVIHEFNFSCPPSNATLWIVDTYWTFLFWEMIIHVVEHMYFMPLVAMSMSWELVSVTAFCSPVLLRFNIFRRWALGSAPFANKLFNIGGNNNNNNNNNKAPMYVFFYFATALSHMHMFVRNSERLKLLAVAIGPFFLSLATFCRFLYPTSFINEGSEENCRLIYSFPLGLVLTMLVRVLFITQDPVFTDPLYSGLFGIILGIVFTIIILRDAMFSKKELENIKSENNYYNNSINNYNDNNNNNNNNTSIKTEIKINVNKSPDNYNDRHVHFSNENQTNSITSLGLSYSSPSPAIMGLLFGLLCSVSLTFYSCANYIPRLLAVEPYPASLIVILCFVLGLFYSQEIIPILGFNKNNNNSNKSWLRLGIAILGGCLTMLLATRQTNRSYELPHDHYPTTETSLKENVDIKFWDAEEEFSGNKYIAFIGGLIMTIGLGALYPLIMEIIFVHQRVRRMSSAGSLISNNSYESNVIKTISVTSFELVWSISTIVIIIIYALCISYPFVPMAWLIRERSVSVHFINVAGVFFLSWYLARRAKSGASVLGLSELANSKKQRKLPLLMKILIAFLFVLVIFNRTALQPPDRSIDSGKTAAIRFPKEVISVHNILRELKKESNNATDPLIEEYQRNFIQQQYEEKIKLLETEVTGEKPIGEKESKKKSLIPPFNISFPHLSKEERKDVWEAALGMTFFSGMIWTVHFALDNGNTDSLKRMVHQADLTGAGVIGLLESDSMHVPNGNRDMVEFMSYSLGYRYTSYGPTALDNTYGCAMISKYPILKVRRYIIPSPLGELSCLIHAELDVFGIIMQTYVGHFGNTEHWADGLLQSQFLGRLVARTPGPSLFLGYLVSYPGNKERYHRYSSPTAPGLFRDTALEIYKKHPWRRLTERGGYDEPIPVTTTTVAPGTPVDFNVDWKLDRVGHLEEGVKIDHAFRRPPAGKDPRYFVFNDTGRISTAHPRFEFIDRYCQYILYKTGATKDERPEDRIKLQPIEVYLYDWWRVFNEESDSLSDTEIQVVQLGFKIRE